MMNVGRVPQDSITRVSEVSLKNFRGFVGEQRPLDTNADLVLITGPNGYGKTSLLEGLLLLLTGWHDPKLDPDEHLLSIEAQSCELLANTNLGPLSLVWNRGHSGALPAVAGLPSSRLTPEDNHELDARICAFFQDRVEYLFDQAARGSTLRDVFEGIPIALKSLQDVLSTLLGKLSEKYQSLNQPWDGDTAEELADSLSKAFRGFREHYAELRSRSARWASSNTEPPPDVDFTALEEFAKQVTGAKSRLERALEDELREEVRRQRVALLSKATDPTDQSRNLQAEINEITVKIDRIHKENPDIQPSDVEAFDPIDPTHPGYLSILESLASNASRWSGVSPSGRLQQAIKEIAAVLEREAHKCAAEVKDWLKPRRELVRLEKERQDLEEALKHARGSVDLRQFEVLEGKLYKTFGELVTQWNVSSRYADWVRRANSRERARKYLSGVMEGVSELKNILDDILLPDEVTREQIRKLAEVVLSRFSLVGGFFPIQLMSEEQPLATNSEAMQRVYNVRTNDKREVKHFSTGQKAQVAVSFLTAQNIGIDHILSNLIILLDDVTTAYDLSNLTREALFWRQLAYGPREKCRPRQVFLSSHHEEMTNHLLELLVPPEGRSMRLLRFVDWTPEHGPEIETLEVECTGSANDPAAREHLAKELAKF